MTIPFEMIILGVAGSVFFFSDRLCKNSLFLDWLCSAKTKGDPLVHAKNTLSCSHWVVTAQIPNVGASVFCHAHKFKLPTSHFIYYIINSMSYKWKHMKSVDRWKDKRVHWLKWMGISWAIKTGVVTLKCLKLYVHYEACMGQQMFWWCNPLQTTSRRGGICRVIVMLQRNDASALRSLFCGIYFMTV